MTYSDVWSLRALQEAARIEQSAADPGAIRRALDWIDFALRRTPEDRGEARSPGFRLWFEEELGVFYRIDETALRVEILFVGPALQS